MLSATTFGAQPTFGQWIAQMRRERRLNNFLARPLPAIVRTPPPTETFGHEPTWINAGACGGCEVCGDREEQYVCARCFTDWPCGTARILNIVDTDGELIEPFAAEADGRDYFGPTPWDDITGFEWVPETDGKSREAA